MEPGKFYENRIKEVNAQLSIAKKSSQRLVLLRGVVFISFAIITYFIFAEDVMWAVPAILFLVLFLYLMKRHESLKQKINYLKALLSLNEAEIAALQHEYSGFYAGSEFDEPAHPYLQDLDIFGPGSVFQYINRTATLTGRQTLAQQFKQPPLQKQQIEQRLQAIAELAIIPEWRQDLQALAYLHPEKEEQKNDLLKWVQHPQQILDSKAAQLLLYIIPAVTLLLLVLSVAGLFPFAYFVLYFFVVPLGFTGLWVKKINRLHVLASEHSQTLEKYAELLRLIEVREWESGLFNDLKAEISSQEAIASGEIKRLSQHISKLDQRLNIMAALFLNGFLLWDLRMCRQIVQWQQKNRQRLPKWINAIGSVDALVSLGTFAYNHPGFAWPQVREGELFIEATEVGHFLLRPEERVNNSITINGKKQLIIITGANMAGKSTFLRTLALNMVVAQLGAPVCAEKFTITPVQVFTSMRMKDSLQKHESYFFAELKRLQQMIERLKNGEKLFIILDEILKGTNTKDQHLGSVGLIRQLLQLNASGIIATHDLSLGKLADEFPQNIRNMRFEIEIENGEMQFDYKLKPGISQNLNASFLMKQMGITAG